MVDTGANPLVIRRPGDDRALGGLLISRPGEHWYSGIYLAEDISQVVDGVKSGDWIDTAIGGVAGSMDALGFMVDPLGSLVSTGVAWLLEHVKPLSDGLDWLAGDPAQIGAYVQTWRNVAGAAGEEAIGLAEAVSRGIPGWTGAAAAAYRQHAGRQQAALAAVAQAAEGIGVVVEGAGLLVAMVRQMVRDLIAEFVSVLTVRLWEWLAEEAGTLGAATPLVMAQVGSLAAKWAAKIVRLLRALIVSFHRLAPVVRKLVDLIKKLRTVLGDLRRVPPKDGDLPGGGVGRPGEKPRRSGSGGTVSGGDRGRSIRSESGRPRDNAVPMDGRRCVGDPVDVASGAVVLTQTDVMLPGALPLVLRRSHVSSYRVGGWFGRSWASTLDQRLEVDADGICFATEDGMLLVYPMPAPAGAVLPVEGPRWPLTRHGAGYTVTDPQRGWTWHFTPLSGTVGVPTAGQVSTESVLPLIAVTDRNGARIDLLYRADGIIEEVRHSGGYRVGVDTTGGRVVGLRRYDPSTGADEPLVRFSYDESGRMIGVINSSGVPLRYGYDGAGRLTGWTDRNGTEYSYIYDHAGRCVRTTGSDGFLDGVFDYDPDRGVTTATDSLGNRSAYHLNERGQVVREVNPLGHVVSRTWDSFDRLLAETDALGQITTYAYDQAGNLTVVTRPDGARAEIVYNEFRRPVTMTGYDGGVWRREYDQRGNQTAVHDPTGATTRYGYDTHGYLSTVVDALGNVTTVTCDGAGLPLAVADPTGAITGYTRDSAGRIIAVTDPLGGVTRYGYTPEGLLGRRALPDGSSESWAYDPEGNLATHIDPTGATTRFEVTHFDLPKARIDPDGTRLEFGYDTELRLTTVTNPQGLTWRYDYDPAGRLIGETDFNGRGLSYAHDAAGHLTARTNGLGQTISYARDMLGNVVVQYTPEGQTRFAYDSSGRLLRAVSPQADVLIDRDPLGRVVAETVNGATTGFKYDAAGRRIYRRTPSGAESLWEYDSRHQPTALHTSGQSLRFTHDQAGRPVETMLATSPAGLHLIQSFDANHRLLAQTVTTGPARIVAQRAYEYRPDGLLCAVDDATTGRRSFDLDQAGRITAVTAVGWHERYAYDSAGNLTDAAWTDPDMPSVTAEARGERHYTGTLIRRAGKIRYEHDQQGRIVLRQLKQMSTKPSTWRYTWNSEDRLIAVTTPDGTHWTYSYDPFGRRIAKTRLGADSTVAERVDFTWDGLQLAEQTRTTTDIRARTTTWNYQPGTFTPVAQTEHNSQRKPMPNLDHADADQADIDQRFYAIVADLTGTPTELVTPDGQIAWHTQTTIWGTTTFTSSTGADCPLRFPGQYHDPETGNHYNNQRYYDPTTARYHTPDPLGLVPAPNPHAYVPNPTQEIDPLGLAPCETDVFVRRGTDWESVSRLGRQAQEAVASGIFPHGVSMTSPESNLRLSRNPEDVATATLRQIEDAGFRLQHTPTRSDSDHHSLILPNPVTPEIARAFNRLLGRSR